MRRSYIGLIVFFIFIQCMSKRQEGLAIQKKQSLPVQQEKTLRDLYPQNWEIKVFTGTKLDSLKQANHENIELLPKKDLDDCQPLPFWFRVFLRKTFTSLPQSGKPQYPREAAQLLQWLENNQNFSLEQLKAKQESIKTSLRALIQENEKRSKYPKEWEVDVPKGTALDSLRQTLDEEFNTLPEKDLEDTAPLPIWFRVYLRKNFPDLATSGPYQYPRTAGRIFQWMLDHPDSLKLENK